VTERADTSSPALHIENVVKSYGPVRALDGVSFDVRAGEFIALLGPNGAGKSTLFQLLSGLFVPDSGRIEVMGHDMSRDPVPALAELGIVFQQPTLDLQAHREIDTNFVVGLFDFPMIDNTRLSGSERCSVSLTALNPNVVSLTLAYFPASRASLKDKPYYDEVIRDLVRERPAGVLP